jgi:2-oxoglutarate ferredoxin oxidoreductase subunit gamma
METSVIISGFGGQGALFAGQALAYAGIEASLHVTWIPSYGPEMRGGTAHCTVILSDEPIGSPLVSQPSIAIVMNRPSLDKYESLVQPDGLLVVNSSLVDRPAQREDIRVIEMPATDMADELGDRRLTNMVLLGAMLAETRLLSLEAVEQSLEIHLPERHRNLLEANRQALRRGAALNFELRIADVAVR